MVQLQTKCQFENMYNQLKDRTLTSSDNEGWLRAKPVDISHPYVTASVRQWCCFTSGHYQATQQLEQMIGVKFVKIDKSSGVVIMTTDICKLKPNPVIHHTATTSQNAQSPVSYRFCCSMVSLWSPVQMSRANMSRNTQYEMATKNP